MQENRACAIITLDEGLLYAFLTEKREAPADASPEEAEKDALPGALRKISGAWCFPSEGVREGEEAGAALHRLLHDRLSLGYTLARELPPRDHNGQRYFPFVCTLKGGGDFRLDSYLAIRLDTAARLRALPWEEPFDKILEEF